MADNNEQWLLQGDCALCRKRKYCGTTCKSHKNSVDLDMTRAFKKALQKNMDKDNATVFLNVVAKGMEFMR